MFTRDPRRLPAGDEILVIVPVRNKKMNISKRRNNYLLCSSNRISDVTLLSLVLVENILFDAACGM